MEFDTFRYTSRGRLASPVCGGPTEPKTLIYDQNYFNTHEDVVAMEEQPSRGCRLCAVLDKLSTELRLVSRSTLE